METDHRPDVQRFAVPVAAAALFGVGAWLLHAGARVPGLGVVTATLALVLAWRTLDQGRPLTVSDRVATGLRIGTHLGVAGMVALAWGQPIGLPAAFYGLAVVVTGLLAIRALTRPRLSLLGSILLFAVAIRASYYYAAPAFGRDSIKHLGLSRYVFEFGEPVPAALNYYHFYPTAHTLVSTVAKVTGAPVRVAYYLGIGLAVVGGIAITALVTAAILDWSGRSVRRAALLAALYLTIAPYHVYYSTHILAQSLSLLFFPIALFAFVYADWRRLGIGLFAAVVLLFTHNTPGMVLVPFGILMVVVARGSGLAGLSIPHVRTSVVVAWIAGITMTYYWMLIEYFDLQVARLLRLFDSQGFLLSTASESSSVAATTGLLQSALLHIGLGLLFGGGVVLAVGLVVLARWWDGRVGFPVDYYVAAAVLFGGLSVVVFVGLDTEIRRLFPFAPILVAPVVGYLFAELGTSGPWDAALAVGVLLLVPTLVLVSATGAGFGPGVPMTEDRPGHLQNYVSHSQIEGARVLGETTAVTTVDRYVVHAVMGSEVSRYPEEDPTDGLSHFQVGVHPFTDVKQIDVRSLEGPVECAGPFYHQDYYAAAFGLDPPRGHRILDVGDASAVTCSTLGGGSGPSDVAYR